MSQASPIRGKPLPVQGKYSLHVVLNLAIQNRQSLGTLHCSAMLLYPQFYAHGSTSSSGLGKTQVILGSKMPLAMKGPQVSILELRATEVYEKNLHKVRNQMEEV